MARDREIVVGLDVGTTKIAAVISRISSNGEVNIIGVGTSPSRGLKNGTVVNMDETVMSIQKAMEEAERIAGVQVRNVVTGISGEHIRTIDANGVIAVSSESGEISKEDVERAMENAKEITLTTGRLLHEIPKEYIVDHQPGIKNPVGMFGKRLELRANLIVGDVNAVNNIVRCVERAGYGVSDVVLQSLASSYSVLEPDEKDLGVILMDIGGGTTDIALFLNGTLNRNFIVPLGGENITSDLAKGLKTSREVAEKIKVKYGAASMEFVEDTDILVPVPGIAGREQKNVSIDIVVNIISMRLQEILEFAYMEIKDVVPFELLTAGLVITGGTAKLKGIGKVAEEVFGLPVKMGIPEKGLFGLKDIVHDPAFATAVGLILYSLQHEERQQLISSGRRGLETLFKKMRSWFEEFF